MTNERPPLPPADRPRHNDPPFGTPPPAQLYAPMSRSEWEDCSCRWTLPADQHGRRHR